MNIETGTIINQYKIISAIGKGGMGEVFLAEDTKLKRQVALKILPSEFAEDKDRMSRFVREAQSASALNHPNIITIYEIGESDGTHFIATEFIDGKTLNEYKLANPLNYKSTLEIAIQVASALDEAHTAGIVHRDIKPDNVMIRANGLAKILDFGIAKLSEKREARGRVGEEDGTLIAQSPNRPITQSPHTQPGMIIGTANYMSPEQAKGKEVDARTDIFSFGVVLYEMIAGQLPFEGENALEMIGAILKDNPKPLNADVPPEITKIINKCLRKDRDERYQTIKDVGNDLKDVKQELELKNLMERSIVPNDDSNKTQILHHQTTTNQTVASNPTKKYLAAGLLTLLLAVGGFFGYKYLSPVKQIESIAVMPFENKSGNADVEYLSDGMTETLINSLSQIPNLNVKARSTVFRYKGKEFDLKKIAAELNVQAILTGQVVQRGDQMTLNLELIDAKTENVLWGNKYERKASDLVSLQSEIARDVSSKLKSKLSSAEVASVEKTYTANSEAYQLYLQGRYHWNKRTATEFEKAVVFFKQAIEKDPNYALAYSGLADTYGLFPRFGAFRPKEYMPQAKQAALKALELDPNLAEAHTSLAQIALFYEYDFTGAEKSFKRAIELDPNYATAHQWYGLLLAYIGKNEESVREAKKAFELDPFSLRINSDLFSSLANANRFDEALLQNKKLNELFPDERRFHQGNFQIYADQGKYDQAVEEFLLSVTADKDFKPENITRMKEAYGKNGWDGFQRMFGGILLEELNAKHAKDPNGYIRAGDFAVAYAWGKDKDKTIEYLNKAYDERARGMVNLKNDKYLDFARDDPRFKELVRKVGIPE